MKFQFCLAKPEEGGVALDDSSTKHSGHYLQILFDNYKVFSSIFKSYKKVHNVTYDVSQIMLTGKSNMYYTHNIYLKKKIVAIKVVLGGQIVMDFELQIWKLKIL